MYIQNVLQKISSTLIQNVNRKMGTHRLPILFNRLSILKNRLLIRSRLKRQQLSRKINQAQQELILHILQVIESIKNTLQ